MGPRRLLGPHSTHLYYARRLLPPPAGDSTARRPLPYRGAALGAGGAVRAAGLHSLGLPWTHLAEPPAPLPDAPVAIVIPHTPGKPLHKYRTLSARPMTLSGTPAIGASLARVSPQWDPYLPGDPGSPERYLPPGTRLARSSLRLRPSFLLHRPLIQILTSDQPEVSLLDRGQRSPLYPSSHGARQHAFDRRRFRHCDVFRKPAHRSIPPLGKL